MKTSGTKKLLIIFLSLICIFAMGVAGVLLSTASYGMASDKPSPTSEISDDTFLNEEGNSATEEYAPEDYLQSPDESETYATPTTWNIYGHQSMTNNAGMKVFNHAGTNVTSSTTWNYFDDGVFYREQKEGYGKMGQRTTITLAPGETFKFQINYESSYAENTLNCEANAHWAYTNFADTIHWNTGTWVIDGDAPTNTTFRIYKQATCDNRGTTRYGFQVNYPYGGGRLADPNVAFCPVWTYEITVVRTALQKPQLITADTAGAPTYSSSPTYAGIKTMTYTGEAASISFTPDYGSGVLDWSVSPANMQVQSRSNHSKEIYNNGANNGSPTKLILETNTAGTYEITLRSVNGAWSDGTRAAVKFQFIVKELTTAKPLLKDDDTGSLLTRTTTKTLNAQEDGSAVTITIGNADSRYVNCSTGGLTLQSWTRYDDTTSPNEVTLAGVYVGTYTITLSLKNPNACKWDDGTTTVRTFTFEIKDIMISKPSIIRETEAGRTDIKYTDTSKTVTYTGSPQSIILSPAKFGSLTINAPGLPATYFEYTYPSGTTVNAVKFTTTNASSFTIKIKPANGYVWNDGSSTEYVFTFKIETVKLESPFIVTNDGSTGATFTKDSKTVEYAFNSTGAVYQSITIKNFIPSDFGFELADAVDIITSMSMTTDSSGNFVFSASLAQEWLVAFTPKTNFEWRSLTDVPAFYLNIERKALITGKKVDPYIYHVPGNELTDSEDTQSNDAEKGNYVKIDGTTKVVNFWGPDELKFIKIYVGGYAELAINNQFDIIIENSNGRPAPGQENGAGLDYEWEIGADGKATGFIKFRGTQAENYLIKITPTDNFKWYDNDLGADYESRDFKLIISPILKDKLSMYLQDSEHAWSPATADSASFDFDGTQKHVVIGNHDENGTANQNYESDKVTYKVVDANGDTVAVSENNPGAENYAHIETYGGGENQYYGLHIYLTNAGEYKVYVTLKDGNYAWRGSASTDAVYNVTISPQQIAAPVLLKEDCHGKQNPDGTYALYFNDEGYPGFGPYMSGDYYGDDMLMVIGLKSAKYIGYEFWTFPTDGSGGLIEDAEMGILDSSDTSGADGYERLFVTARSVGTHIVRLYIKDKNFRWAGDSMQEYYDFLIIINYATVSDATFSVTTKDASGNDVVNTSKDGGSMSVEFNASEYKIVIGRERDDIVDINTQFKVSVTSSVGNITEEEGGIVCEKDKITVSALHAGTYYVTVSLDPNYRWNYPNLNKALQPHYYTFVINPKQVEVPKIVNNGYGDINTSGVDYDRNTRMVTFDRDTNWQLSVYLGADYQAFSVNVIANGQGRSLSPDATFQLADTVKYRKGSTETVLNDTDISHFIAYAANHAGDYELTVDLVNDLYEDYVWTESEPVRFCLSINQKGVKAPVAYVEKEGTEHNGVSDINKMDINSDNNYTKTVVYVGTEYWVYFLGEIIGYNTQFNDDGRNAISVNVTALNPDNADRMEYGYVTSNNNNVTTTDAYRLKAAQANTYRIVINFIEGEEGDYYWNEGGVNDRNYDPKVFTLVIGRAEMVIPYIVGSDRDPAGTVVTPAADSYGADDDGNGYYASYTYQALTHRTITIALNDKYLNENYGFVEVSESSQAKATVDKKTGLITLTSNLGSNGDKAAKVSGVYRVTLSVGPNSCWTPSVAGVEDIQDKYFYIKITPQEVDLPTLIGHDSDNEFVKSVTYNPSMSSYGTAGSPALQINDFNSVQMTYGNDPGRIDVTATGTTVKGNTKSGNAGSYDISINLSDPVNYKWKEVVVGTDPDTGDDIYSTYGSGALTYSFVVKPGEIASPKLVNDGRADADFSDDYTVTVTYNFNEQTFDIKDYVTVSNYEEYISLEATSSLKLIPGTTYLNVRATNAGEYTITFTLNSINMVWSDVAENTQPVTIKIIIKKLGLDRDGVSEMPHINDDTGTDIADGVIVDTDNGEQKTVTYVYNSATAKGVEQYMNIINYNPTLFTLNGTTGNIKRTEPTSPGTTYKFGATDAEIYTVTFKLVDSANRCWNSDETDERNASPYITFTFIINKLELSAPKIETGYLRSDDLDTVTGNTFTTTYDSKAHVVLVKNILDSSYMSFKDDKTYADPKDERLTLSGAAIASSGSLTVGGIFGFSGTTTFADALVSDTTVVNASDYILFSATAPGKYYVKVAINDDNRKNMVWVDEAGNPLTVYELSFVLDIQKMAHDAPDYMDDRSKEYTGDLIDFYIQNADNGRNAAGVLVTFEYETAGSMASNPATAHWEIKEWFDGVLHLQAKEVGTYYITIYINDPTTTYWRDTTEKKHTFTFEVIKRTLGAEVTYSSTDTDTDNDLAAGTIQWTLDKPVVARVALTNVIAIIPGVTGTCVLYNDITVDIYYTVSGSNDAKRVITVTPDMWQQEGVFDTGTFTYTYTLYYDYEIPYGDGNILRNNYQLHVVQNGTTGNYTLSERPSNFTVLAPAAPFDTDWLIWRYKIVGGASDTAGAYIDVNPATDFVDGELNLEYLDDGGTYYFEAYMNTVGMNGKTEFANALLDWEVTFNGSYSGKRFASYTGDNYYVAVTIKAKDLSKYYFADYTFRLDYNITATKYNLDNLYWIYEHTDPDTGNTVIARWDGTDSKWYDVSDGVTEVEMTFDGTPHTVKLISSDGTGALPEGLTVKKYTVVGDEDLNNSQIYVGSYTITVEFTTSSTNYGNPDVTDPTTYLGTFDTSCVLTIGKKTITASWLMKQSATDSGVSYVPKLDPHAEKVDVLYYLMVGSTPASDPTDDFTNVPNTFRATATLKSNPGDPATDYARNYTLVITNGNTGDPFSKDFYLATVPGITVVVNLTDDYTVNDDESVTPTAGTGAALSTTVSNGFTYIKKAYVAYIDSIAGGTGGLTIDDNFDIKYYSTANEYKPLAGLPTKPGDYIVKISLKDLPDDGNSYSLSDTKFYFTIEKGDLDESAFIWVYTHTDADNNLITATWDGYKWVDGAGAEVKVVYDGLAHQVDLIYNPNYPGEYPAVDGEGNPIETVDLIVVTKNPHAFINAGTYQINAYYVYDGSIWNDPAFTPTLSFTVEKVKYDLSGNVWDYEDGDFEFEIEGGNPVTHTMTILGIPSELEDYVAYATYLVIGGKQNETAEEGNSFSNAASYITIATFKEIPADANFEIVDYPASYTAYPANTKVPAGYIASGYATQPWKIIPKQLDIPSITTAWQQFDGNIHNLLDSLNLDPDWASYFSIKITFNGSEHNGQRILIGSENRWTGSVYSAYNAGTYVFELSIDTEKVNIKIDGVDQINAVWVTGTPDDTADKTVSLPIAKKQISILTWTGTGINQKVVLGDPQEYKYIDYMFWTGNSGKTSNPDEQVTLDDILSTEVSKDFSIIAVIKDEYASNVALQPLDDYKAFTTPTLPDKDQWQEVGEKPYISGYIINGTYTSFYDEDDATTLEEKIAKVAVVQYNGSPITFVINNWDYYSTYAYIWNGDNLTQNAAGVTYSVTIILKTNSSNPYYWTVLDDGEGNEVYDRTSVTLKFRIDYLKIKAPEVSEDITYTGREINIVDESYNDDWAALYGEYADYVEISGIKATNAGTYTITLKIKDEYASTVVWDIGKGDDAWASGTHTIEWTIKQVYLIKPSDQCAPIDYDGNVHSVREVLTVTTFISDEDLLKEYLDALWDSEHGAHIGITGRTAIDAGTYDVTFALPDSNYTWATHSEVNGLQPVSGTDPVTVRWTIKPKELDYSKLGWNFEGWYYNDKGDLFYDEECKSAYNEITGYPGEYFSYTLKDGVASSFSVTLMNLPEELVDIVSFVTFYDPTGANTEVSGSVSQVGKYRTIVYLFITELDRNCQPGTLATSFKDDYSGDSIGAWLVVDWEIKAREFTVPKDNEITYYFDGTSGYPDLLDMLDFGEGWENYLEVSVSVYDEETDTFVDYEGVDGSLYLADTFGIYNLTISIKSDVNVDGNVNVAWVDENGDRLTGDAETAPQTITINYVPVKVTVTDWNTDDDIPVIVSADFDKLPDYAKELFEYRIYLYDEYQAGLRNVKEADELTLGYTYLIEFTVKEEYTADLEKGNIQMLLKTGVSNPFEFGMYDFEGQQIIWLPLPTLNTTSQTFTAEDLTFTVSNYSDFDLSALIASLQTQVSNVYTAKDLPIPTNLVEILNLNPANGVIKIEKNGDGNFTGNIIAVKAGTYEVTLRFVSLINLSWYDPALYYVDGAGKLCYVSGAHANGLVSDYEREPENRHSQTLKFEVTKAAVKPADPNWFALKGIPLEVVYNGSEICITTYKDENVDFEALFNAFLNDFGYGKLVTFKNEKKTYAGTYTLVIELTDPESSYWALSTYTDVKFSAADLKEQGYDIRWIFEDGQWELKLLVRDAEGNQVEYNGVYSIKASFEVDYVTEYTEELDSDILEYYIKESGDYVKYRVVYVNATGQPIENPETYAGQKYETYVKDANGSHYLRYKGTKVVIPGKQLVDENGEPIVGEDGNFVYGEPTISYTLVSIPKKDENGNQYVDFANTVVIIREYDNLNGEVDLIEWKITTLGVGIPELTGNGVDYTGKEITLANLSGLLGYVSSYMEIAADGGSATDAGTYTATITLTDGNHHWIDAAGNAIKDDSGKLVLSVTLDWTINPIQLTDIEIGKLNNAYWQITGGETYTFVWDKNEDGEYTWIAQNGYPMYTRKDGKAVTYKISLMGLEDTVFDGHIVYTTNKSEKAHAGINAGKYTTSFVFDNLNGNFGGDIELPVSLTTPIVWNIEKRVMPMPKLEGSLSFDGTSTFNLLELIGLEKDGDWQQYFSITVLYASRNIYVAYEGYDVNGDGKIEGDEKYTAFYAGSYSIKFNMLPGVNDKYKNIVFETDGASTPSANSSKTNSGAATTASVNANVANSGAQSATVKTVQSVQPVYTASAVSVNGVTDKLVAPATFAVYAEGDEDEDEDDGDIIVPPEDPEDPEKPDPGEVPDITVTVDKLILVVERWQATTGIDAFIQLKGADSNAYISKFLDRNYYNIDGRIVTYKEIEEERRSGITFFVKYEVKAEYAQSVELVYEDGVQHVYSFTTNFEDYEEIGEKPTFDTLTYTFTSKQITVDITAIRAYIAQHPYLTIVESESDLTAIDVGNYSITICFKDEEKCCWNGMDRSPVFVEWKIVQAQINGKWNSNGTLYLESDDYKGSYEGIVVVVYKDLDGNVVEFKDLVPGTRYKAEAILKDTSRFSLKVSPNPFEFTAGTVVTLDRPVLVQDTFFYTSFDITVQIENWSAYRDYVTITGNTGKEAGAYTVTIHITDTSRFVWSDGLCEDITLTFVINKAIINGFWNATLTVNPYCDSESYQGSFESVIRYEYYAATDISMNYPLSLDELVEGNMYRVYAFITDEAAANFGFADGLIKDGYVCYEFRYGDVPPGGRDKIMLDVPHLEIESVYYTGEMITFVIADWDKYYNGYLEITSGSLRHMLAGEYSVTLSFNAEGKSLFIWIDDRTARDITITFVIHKAVLTGEWNSNGRVDFKSTYTGNYDTVIEYRYVDMDGNPVSYANLQAGVKYKALVVLRDVDNFEFAKDFSQEFEFTFKGRSSFPWWIILLIIIAIIIIIVIIIIIIIVARRKKEEKKRREQEDYYDSLADNEASRNDDADDADDDYSDIYGDTADTGEYGDSYEDSYENSYDDGYDTGDTGTEDFSDIYGDTEDNDQ